MTLQITLHTFVDVHFKPGLSMFRFVNPLSIQCMTVHVHAQVVTTKFKSFIYPLSIRYDSGYGIFSKCHWHLCDSMVFVGGPTSHI